MIFTPYLDGGGFHRALGVVGLDLGLQITADAGQCTARIEGVDPVTGKAEYVGAGFHIVEDLVAGVALAQHAELEFVLVLGIGFGVGIAHLLEHLLVFLGAPDGQGDLFGAVAGTIVVPATVACSVSGVGGVRPAASAGGQNTAQHDQCQGNGG